MDLTHTGTPAIKVCAGIIVLLFIFFLIPSTTPAAPPISDDYNVEAFMGSVEKELCILLCNGLYSKLAIRPESVLRQMNAGSVVDQSMSTVEVRYLSWEYDIRQDKTMIDRALNEITTLYRSQRGYSVLNRDFNSIAPRYSEQETESMLNEISRQDNLQGF